MDPTAGPVQRFAWELRELRRAGGAPTYRAMAERVPYSAPALSQAAAGERLPSLAVALAYVSACGGDAGEWARKWRSAAREVAAEPPRDGEEPPYLGPESFQCSDADRFFGRDELVSELVELVGRHPVVAVVGASGSGKTSLLRAGLMPRLAGPVRLLTPADGWPAHWSGTLVVDRIEEAAPEFLESLRHSAGDRRVVVAARSDCPGLAGMPRLVMRPPGPGELREMIVKPAAAAGLIVERVLTATLIEELADEPGSLPVLSRVLLEVWRRRRGRSLTVEGYRAAGGVSGILAATAEELFTGLSPRTAAPTRCLLLRLVAPGDGTPDARRAAAPCELDDVPPDVVERLASARLITVDEDGIQLSHRALITAWPRLRGWLERDRDRLRFLRRLTEATREWERLGRDPGALYRGTRLARARNWLSRNESRGDLTAAERAFVRHSIQADDREATLTRRRGLRIRWLAVAATVLLICAVTGVAIAVRELKTANDQSRLARSRQLAAQAQTAASGDVAAAARYAVEAMHAYPSAEARSALLTVAGRPNYHGRMSVPSGHPAEVAVSPRGDVAVSRDPRRGVTVWDVAGRREAWTLPETAGGTGMSFSANGKLLATAAGGRVAVWDIDTRTPRVRFAARAGAVALNPAGDRVVTADAGRIMLWDARNGAELARLPGGDWTPASLRFGPDGRLLASRRDGSVALWDIAEGRQVAKLTPPRPALPGVALSPDGRLIATTDGQTVILWDANSFQNVAELAAPGRRLAFVPGRPTLLAVGQDNDLALWDVDSRQLVAVLPAGTSNSLQDIASSPDGRTIFAATDSAILLWQREWLPLLGHTGPVADVVVDRRTGQTISTGTDRLLRRWLTGRESLGSPLPQPLAQQVFSRDGTRLATASGDGTVAVWDTARTVAPVAVVPRAGSIALSVDGHLLAVADDENVTVWDVEGTAPVQLATLAFKALSLAFSPDGGSLLAGYLDVTVWDTTTWSASARYSGFGAPALGVAAGPGARSVAAIGADGAVSLWANDSSEPQRLAGLTGQVRAVAFSADGRLLAAAGEARMISIWEVATGEPWATLTGHRARINALTWTPDGLLSASSDNTITLWPTNPTAATARLCQALHTNFPTTPTPAPCA